jgi:hypothetical protein
MMNHKNISLKEIVQQCPSGLGDCVVGYVSCYILKKQLEKQFHQEINLSINWSGVVCPYINPSHLFKGQLSQYNHSYVSCLHGGQDGTLYFNNYYHSQRFISDIHQKTYLVLKINQYVGKCFINTSRTEIEQWTYAGYQYFWNQVLNQGAILGVINVPVTDYQQLVTIYVRLGDQYLCEKQDSHQSLVEHYRHLQAITLTDQSVALIGDTNNQTMNQTYQQLYPQSRLVELSGVVSHSCEQLGNEQWGKIFSDLYLLLRAKIVIILSNNSNFFRIVLFLKQVPDQKVYVLLNGQLILINDLSRYFAKHYTF